MLAAALVGTVFLAAMHHRELKELLLVRAHVLRTALARAEASRYGASVLDPSRPPHWLRMQLAATRGEALKPTGTKAELPALVHVPHTSLTPSTVTVTSVFVLTPTKVKHSLSEYEGWMADFLQSVTAPLVLYVANYPIARIRAMRGALPIFIHEVNSTWDLPYAAQMRDAYTGPQWRMDPENAYHTPELYAIWNAKAGMLAATAKANPFGSQFFVYADVGLFRLGKMAPWPQEERVHSMFHKRPSAMVFGLVDKLSSMLWVVDQLPTNPTYAALQAVVKRDLVMGGFFAGNAAAVARFAEAFYFEVIAGAAAGVFVGKEQNIMNFIAAREYHAQSVAFIGGEECGNPWWYVTHFLTNTTHCSLKRLDSFP